MAENEAEEMHWYAEYTDSSVLALTADFKEGIQHVLNREPVHLYIGAVTGRRFLVQWKECLFPDDGNVYDGNVYVSWRWWSDLGDCNWSWFQRMQPNNTLRHYVYGTRFWFSEGPFAKRLHKHDSCANSKYNPALFHAYWDINYVVK